MTTDEIVAVLKELRSRFLEGLSSQEVSALVAAATVRRFKASQIISHQGYPADYFYLLVSGRARYFSLTPRGEKVPLLWAPAGDILGPRALVPGRPDYLASAEAVVDSTVLVWDRATIRALVKQSPKLIENLWMIASDYVVAYDALHMAARSHTARQRVAQVLGTLARGMGRKVAEGVELNIRNEELANEANVTIFTVSRMLSEWQRKGLLVKSHGKVMLRSPEKLIQMEG
jgi:CRP-like cAMP-binding protein